MVNMLKCLLKSLSRKPFALCPIHQNSNWSHTRVSGNIQYTHYLKYDLCTCAIHIWSLITINNLLTYFIYNAHPFTMEERKVNIVQRQTGTFIQDISLGSCHTKNRSKYVLQLNILQYNKCIRIQILSCQSPEESTFSHPCASRTSLHSSQRIRRFIGNLIRRPINQLQTFSQAQPQKQKKTLEIASRLKVSFTNT